MYVCIARGGSWVEPRLCKIGQLFARAHGRVHDTHVTMSAQRAKYYENIFYLS